MRPKSEALQDKLIDELRDELADLRGRAIVWAQICATAGYAIGVLVGVLLW